MKKRIIIYSLYSTLGFANTVMHSSQQNIIIDRMIDQTNFTKTIYTTDKLACKMLYEIIEKTSRLSMDSSEDCKIEAKSLYKTICNYKLQPLLNPIDTNWGIHRYFYHTKLHLINCISSEALTILNTEEKYKTLLLDERKNAFKKLTDLANKMLKANLNFGIKTPEYSHSILQMKLNIFNNTELSVADIKKITNEFKIAATQKKKKQSCNEKKDNIKEAQKTIAQTPTKTAKADRVAFPITETITIAQKPVCRKRTTSKQKKLTSLERTKIEVAEQIAKRKKSSEPRYEKQKKTETKTKHKKKEKNH